MGTCTTCPESALNWDSSSKTCVANCPLETPVLTEIPYGDRTCVSCEMRYGAAKSFWDPKVSECVRLCPDDTPTVDASKTCMSCKEANASAPFWNPATRECVAKCPETHDGNECKNCADDTLRQPYWNGHSCQSCADAFPGEKEYWDPIKKECVPECKTSIENKELKLCSSCEQG